MYGWLALEIMSKGSNIYIIVNHTKLQTLKKLLVITSLLAIIASSCKVYSPQRPTKQYRCVVGNVNYWRN